MARHEGRRHVPFSYRVLHGWARTAVSVVYRRVTVTAASRVPNDRPVILAANHGNALADVAVIVATMPEFPHFLAAASWWKSAPARVLFRLGGAVPIHRRRDGEDTRQNTSAFEACNAALASGAQIAIFPEGEMHLEPSLLPLKTGVARIALGAAAEAGLDGVVIVPVGLVYEDRGRFRSNAEIHFGEPIAIVDWLDEYRVDPTKAVHGVTDLLADRLARVTVNHGSSDEAALLDRTAAYALADEPDANDGRQFARRNALRRKLASSIALAGGESSTDYRALAAAVAVHERDLQRLGIQHASAVPLGDMSAVDRIALEAQLVALALPAALGLIANGPMLLGVWIASRRVRHEAWQATTKGVGGTFLSPIIWALEFAFLSSRLGRRRALALTTAGAIGGVAALGWGERFLQWRHGVFHVDGGHRRDALDEARASRNTVRQRVAALVGTLPAAAVD
jgi:glycerol-3-phosphate O-acyltransferase/dihydroxyacetone phosphate acyltransferase